MTDGGGSAGVAAAVTALAALDAWSVAAVAALVVSINASGVVGSDAEAVAASTPPDSMTNERLGSAIRLVAALQTAAIRTTIKINVSETPQIFTAPRTKLPRWMRRDRVVR